MNGVDTASQLRGGFSCHKPYEAKWWRPILYWLLDICANNAFLLWKITQHSSDHKLHQRFIDVLIDELLHHKWTPHPSDISLHDQIRLPKKERCAYGRKR